MCGAGRVPLVLRLAGMTVSSHDSNRLLNHLRTALPSFLRRLSRAMDVSHCRLAADVHEQANIFDYRTSGMSVYCNRPMTRSRLRAFSSTPPDSAHLRRLGRMISPSMLSYIQMRQCSSSESGPHAKAEAFLSLSRLIPHTPYFAGFDKRMRRRHLPCIRLLCQLARILLTNSRHPVILQRLPGHSRCPLLE